MTNFGTPTFVSVVAAHLPVFVLYDTCFSVSIAAGHQSVSF